MTETYTIPGDFNNGLKISQLTNEITQNIGIVTNLLGITREDTQVYIIFISSITAPEKIILDSIVALHIPNIIVDALPGVGALIRFITIFNPTSPLSNNYTTIASNLWNQDRYNNFDDTGKVIFTSTVTDNPLEIRIWDTVNMTSLGYYQSNGSESAIFSINRPISNTEIEIQIKKTNNSGITPVLVSIAIEYIC